MYLVKTSLEGTQFKIKYVKGQKNEAAVGASVSYITATSPMFTKFPIGTLFVVDNIAWGEVVSGTTSQPRALFHEKQLFLGDSVTKPTNADVEYLIDWMLSSPEFGAKLAQEYGDMFLSAGYTIDVKSKIDSYVGDTSGSLREQIMRKFPCPNTEDIGFHVDSDVWYLLIRNILRGENTMLIGPTGSGKTELVSHVASALSKTVNYQDMGTIQDSQSALLGVHRLNKEGHSVFDYAPFVSYVQQDGIILLDELNRAPLSASNILFPCLDRRRYLPLDIASDSEERHINLHKDCVFFATANLGAEYTGTTQIDRALLDRFMPVELSYPSEEVESNILRIRTGINEKTAKAIVKVSKTIRQQFKEQELSNVVSVRHTILVANLIKDGFDTVGALMKVIMPLFEESDGVSERTKVKSIIAAQ